MNRPSRRFLNTIFNDAIDELDITFDVYYEVDRHRRICLATAKWLLNNGIESGASLVLSSFPLPLTMYLSKLGFSVEEKNISDHEELTRGKNEIHLSNIDTLSSLQQKYDVIICDNLLQLFEFPSRTIRILQNLLSNDGILLIITPNAARITTRITLLLGHNISPPLEGNHAETISETPNYFIKPYREYTLTEVKNLLSDGGLSVTGGRYIIGKKTIEYNFLMPPLSVSSYLARKLNFLVQLFIAPFRSHLLVAAKKINQQSKMEKS